MTPEDYKCSVENGWKEYDVTVSLSHILECCAMRETIAYPGCAHAGSEDTWEIQHDASIPRALVKYDTR